jgi:hypothetical protein
MLDGAVSTEALRGLRGLWQYLIVRSQLRAKMVIEQERNRAYADHRDRLPDNAELMDYEDSYGRRFWIRKNEPPGGRPGPQLLAVVFIPLGSAAAAEVLRPANEPTDETMP